MSMSLKPSNDGVLIFTSMIILSETLSISEPPTAGPGTIEPSSLIAVASMIVKSTDHSLFSYCRIRKSSPEEHWQMLVEKLSSATLIDCFSNWFSTWWGERRKIMSCSAHLLPQGSPMHQTNSWSKFSLQVVSFDYGATKRTWNGLGAIRWTGPVEYLICSRRIHTLIGCSQLFEV